MWYDMWYDMMRYDMIYDMWYDIRYDIMGYDMVYLLTAVGLTPGGSSTVHIYSHTIHRTTRLTRTTQLTTEQHN